MNERRFVAFGKILVSYCNEYRGSEQKEVCPEVLSLSGSCAHVLILSGWRSEEGSGRDWRKRVSMVGNVLVEGTSIDHSGGLVPILA